MRLLTSRAFVLSGAELWLVCFVLLALAGCGGGRQMVPVSGQVTYDGGEWPMAGTISFAPTAAEDGSLTRPGTATFGKDGKFVVSSYETGDGLVPGVYHVNISCVDPLDFTKPTSELDIVPQDFHPDDLVVEAGMDPIVLNYDVPKKAK